MTTGEGWVFKMICIACLLGWPSLLCNSCIEIQLEVLKLARELLKETELTETDLTDSGKEFTNLFETTYSIEFEKKSSWGSSL